MIYGEKDIVTLQLISSEYYLSSISFIHESNGFFAISSGNLIVVAKASRGLSYVYDKTKLKGVKMLRSFEGSGRATGGLLV